MNRRVTDPHPSLPVSKMLLQRTRKVLQILRRRLWCLKPRFTRYDYRPPRWAAHSARWHRIGSRRTMLTFQRRTTRTCRPGSHSKPARRVRGPGCRMARRKVGSSWFLQASRNYSRSCQLVWDISVLITVTQARWKTIRRSQRSRTLKAHRTHILSHLSYLTLCRSQPLVKEKSSIPDMFSPFSAKKKLV